MCLPEDICIKNLGNIQHHLPVLAEGQEGQVQPDIKILLLNVLKEHTVSVLASFWLH